MACPLCGHGTLPVRGPFLNVRHAVKPCKSRVFFLPSRKERSLPRAPTHSRNSGDKDPPSALVIRSECCSNTEGNNFRTFERQTLPRFLIYIYANLNPQFLHSSRCFQQLLSSRDQRFGLSETTVLLSWTSKPQGNHESKFVQRLFIIHKNIISLICYRLYQDYVEATNYLLIYLTCL